MRPIYVDAFNMIHAIPHLRGTSSDRGPPAACVLLLELFKRWFDLHPDPPTLTLVFDGNRPSAIPARPPHRKLRLRFMLDRADADMKQLLDRAGDAILVSDDGELVTYARNLGKSTRAPTGFYDDLRTDIQAWSEVAERSPNLTPAEVDYWLETYGGTRKNQPPAPPPDAGPAISKDEVDHWLDYFKDAPD